MNRVVLLLLPAVLLAADFTDRAQFVNGNLKLLPQPDNITTGSTVRDIKDPCHFKIQLESTSLLKQLTPAIDRLSKELFRAATDFCPLPAAQGVTPDVLMVRVKNESAKNYTTDLDESYLLEVSATNISLTAETFVGVLRGLETFGQLVHFDRASFEEAPKYYIPKTPIRIEDKPGYRHRGLLIDLSASQPTLGTLQRVVVAMATLKMNILHLSFSSDTSFALPTKEAKVAAGQLDEEALLQLRRFAQRNGVRVYGSINAPFYVGGLPNGGKEGIFGSCVDADGKRFTYLNVSHPDAVPHVAGLLAQVQAMFLDELTDVGGFKLGGTECAGVDKKVDVRSTYFQMLLGSADFVMAKWKKIVWADKVQSLTPKGEVYHYFGTTGNATLFLNNSGVSEVILSPIDQFFLACGVTPLVEDFECGFRSWLSFYDYNPQIYFGENAGKVRGVEMVASGAAFNEETIVNLIFPRMIGLAERMWTRKTADNVAERVIAARRRLLNKGVHFGPVTNSFCEANVGKCFGSL